MRQLLAAGHGFKAVRRRVLGQQFLQRQVDAEQIVNGVLVLAARQPPHLDATALGLVLEIGGVQRPLEIIHESRDPVGGRPGFLLRGHFAFPNPVENPNPTLEIGVITRPEVEVEEIEAALVGAVVVTLVAMLGQESIDHLAG